MKYIKRLRFYTSIIMLIIFFFISNLKLRLHLRHVGNAIAKCILPLSIYVGETEIGIY